MALLWGLVVRVGVRRGAVGGIARLLVCLCRGGVVLRRGCRMALVRGILLCWETGEGREVAVGERCMTRGLLSSVDVVQEEEERGRGGE